MTREVGQALDFVVRRDDLRQSRFVDTDPKTLAPRDGDALLRVDAFAFTANNVTYAVAGEMMRYWSFFPAEEGWGRVPVWGFGEVIESRHPEVAEGERVYGYFPMSSYLRLQPGAISPQSFADVSPHRQGLPPVYNQYTRLANDPVHDPEREDARMLYWPLFVTSFLIDDFLADGEFFGAEAVLLSSASSKTSFALAFLLSRRRAGQAVVGLTSPSHREFVRGLGCYDEVVTYDEVTSLAADRPTAFVDMAGNGSLTAAIHRHFGSTLVHSAVVGMTHWEQAEREPDLPGPAPTFFFAPDRVAKRTGDWGPDGLQRRMAEVWRPFVDFTETRLEVVHGRGRKDVEKVYLDTLEGRARPDQGHVLTLHD